MQFNENNCSPQMLWVEGITWYRDKRHYFYLCITTLWYLYFLLPWFCCCYYSVIFYIVLFIVNMDFISNIEFIMFMKSRDSGYQWWMCCFYYRFGFSSSDCVILQEIWFFEMINLWFYFLMWRSDSYVLFTLKIVYCKSGKFCDCFNFM